MTTSITGLSSALLQQRGLHFDSTARRQDAVDTTETPARSQDEVRLTGISSQEEANSALAFITQSASEGTDISTVHSGLDPARVAQLIGLFDDE